MPKSPSKSDPDELGIVGTVTIRAAEAPGANGKKKPRTFDVIAYTGGPLDQSAMGWGYPVVCDLEGFDLGDEVFPVLDNHGPGWSSDRPVREYVVAQSKTAAIEGGKLRLTGTFFENRPAAKDIIQLADDGLKWQMSIGAKSLKTEFIGDGLTVNVNGREFEGPVNVVRKTKLREVSFVVIGADDQTSALVAANQGKTMKRVKNGKRIAGGAKGGKRAVSGRRIRAADEDEDKTKDTEAADTDFNKWCEAEGYGDTADMTDKMKAKLRAEYDEQDDEDEDEEDEDTDKGKDTEASDEDDDDDDAPSDTKAAGRRDIKAIRAEQARIAGIQGHTAAHPGLMIQITRNRKTVEVPLAEHAIKAGWSPDQVAKKIRVETIRGSRQEPGPHWYSPSDPLRNQSVIEAAILQLGGATKLLNNSFYQGGQGLEASDRRVPEEVQREVQSDFKAAYSEQVLDSARKLYKGGIDLHQVLTIAARGGGYKGDTRIGVGNIEEVLQCAFRSRDIRADGGSTISIQNLLANVLNKFLLTGYLNANMAWKEVCTTRPVKDFKPTKSINVTGDMLFLKLNADGQIQSAALTDEPYANQIDTFARMLKISRQMIINDDISGLTTVPMLLGVGCSDSISKLFWTLFLNPPNWTDGNAFYFNRNTAPNALGGGAIQSNLVAAGAGSALSVDGLQAAVTLFDMQVKANGQPLGVEPAILIYPPALDSQAVSLMNSQFIVYGGATAAKQPQENAFKGRFKPVKVPYLQNPLYTGFSALAWYLFANPQLTGLSSIEMAFLNGQETPTVQTAQANFNELGIDIRGFHDYGAAMQNPRAGVKSPGA
ncbi:MAG: hypothetical protein JWO38_4884 [Gemmataceae bacterium]|nr:hypothetical protein [Gemmataceae bacterium]